MLPVVSGLRPAKIGMNHLGLLGSTKNHPLFFPIFGGLANGKHAHPKKNNIFIESTKIPKYVSWWFSTGSMHDRGGGSLILNMEDGMIPSNLAIQQSLLIDYHWEWWLVGGDYPLLWPQVFKLVNYYIYSNLIFPDRCFSNINNDIWHWFSNLFFCHNSYPKRSNSKYEQC